jgi:hypothetical protein
LKTAWNGDIQSPLLVGPQTTVVRTAGFVLFTFGQADEKIDAARTDDARLIVTEHVTNTAVELAVPGVYPPSVD